ncbi:MAG TPA: hypothetical protein VHF92_02445 [Geodermatophilus sp.]|nr:hypothetical protein [Geodermatophilus sp.]
MGADPVFFARPEGERSALHVAPHVAAWLATGYPDPFHVRELLTLAEETVRPRLRNVPDPLALRLDVGLPEDVRLLDQYDLDRYLRPLTTWLEARSGREFACVWATKGRAEDSYLRVARADPPAHRVNGDREFRVRAAPWDGEQVLTDRVQNEAAQAEPLPDGPVALQLSFAVPPEHEWTVLWRRTIDGLCGVLGPASDDRPWQPCAGRIVDLGLHRTVDPSLTHEVVVTVVARAIAVDAASR